MSEPVPTLFDSLFAIGTWLCILGIGLLGRTLGGRMLERLEERRRQRRAIAEWRARLEDLRLRRGGK